MYRGLPTHQKLKYCITARIARLAVFTAKNGIFGSIKLRFQPFGDEHFDFTANFSLNFITFVLSIDSRKLAVKTYIWRYCTRGLAVSPENHLTILITELIISLRKMQYWLRPFDVHKID